MTLLKDKKPIDTRQDFDYNHRKFRMNMEKQYGKPNRNRESQSR